MTPSDRTGRALTELQCPTCGLTFMQTNSQQKYDRYECRPRRWGKRGKQSSAAQRGYGFNHRMERKRWVPLVANGDVPCARPDCLHVARDEPRWIAPGEPWDLGHDRSTGSWRGPEHADCNRNEGAVYRNQKRALSAPSIGTVGSTRW